MHGLKGPKLIEVATGIGTHELLADITVDGARLFEQLYSTKHTYWMKKHVCETTLLSKR